MLVKQMSVFVENTTGRLADLTGVLAASNIDIIACTIADTVGFRHPQMYRRGPGKGHRYPQAARLYRQHHRGGRRFHRG